MPHNDDSKILNFRACCDLYGDRQPLTYGRRNGQPVAFPARSFDLPTEPAVPERSFDEQHRFFVNLNPLERETWRKILAAQSIASIAEEEGVTRATIYARIRGNSFGRGGMIGRNFWVLLWWRLRQRMTAGAR
jgi:hypothetical protein